jgi:hypothetical protein
VEAPTLTPVATQKVSRELTMEEDVRHSFVAAKTNLRGSFRDDLLLVEVSSSLEVIVRREPAKNFTLGGKRQDGPR